MTCRFDEQFDRITFMGREWKLLPWGEPSSLLEVKFPVEAFKDFLRAEGLPMPDFWQDVPGTALKPAPAACSVTAAPSQQDECREVEPSKTAPTAAPSVASGINAPGAEILTDEHEIVPGITVSDVRAMIEANSPAYCPRLLAAIQTKKDLMPNEALMRNESAYNRMAKKKAIPILKELGVENPKDKGRPADLDVNAVVRVLCRTRKKLEGRPKNS